jgi:anhydro-N-acetylmuramic acid kinase
MRIGELVGFSPGLGTRLLDEIVSLGTRNREHLDTGGTKAVQGRCLEEILAAWISSDVDRSETFVSEAFRDARTVGGSLNDLLCTTTHLIARRIRQECDRRLPVLSTPWHIYVSGGGVRNGFLWKLLSEQFSGYPLARLDALGVPPSARVAAEAAILTALTMDGITVNSPLITGASAGRLLARFTPGEPKNWARCVSWMAEHFVDPALLIQAA